MKLTRKIFFWSLVVAFIIITPIAILYTLGYRYNLERGVFIYSGSVTIKSNPQDVTIKIDGDEVSQKKLNRINNSYHLDGIKPGDHFIEVSAPGYQSWTKKTTIHSGISSEYWNVILVKNSYDKKRYVNGNIVKYFISPNNKKIAYVEHTDKKLLVNVFDFSSEKSEEVFSSDTYDFFDDFEQENIEWSPQSEKIIIPVRSNAQKDYFVIDITTKESMQLSDTTKTTTLDDVRWSPDNKNVVFYISEKSLWRFDISTNQAIKIANDVSGYDISSTNIFYFSPSENTISQTNLTGTADPIRINTFELDGIRDKPCKMIVYDKKRIALTNKENNSVYVFNIGENGEYFKKLGENINGIQFSNDGKKLLFWSQQEINIHFLRNWEVQPQRKEDETYTVIRFSNQVKNVQWGGDYEHIIFSVPNEGTIKITEADQRDHRNTNNIISFSGNSNAIINDAERKIFFTDIDESRETNTLYSIEFPERSGLLGL